MASLDNRFYEELGIPRTAWTATHESTWDIWIQSYFDHRRPLGSAQRSRLHENIDRFWMMVQEGKYWPKAAVAFDLGGRQAAELLAKHRIESPAGHRADLWLKLAGAYVEGRKRKKHALDRQAGQSPNIATTMPPGWLDDPDSGKKGPGYNYWLGTLAEGDNWQKFVRSYNNDAHAVTIGNATVCASLRSFANQRYMEKYWPPQQNLWVDGGSGRAPMV